MSKDATRLKSDRFLLRVVEKTDIKNIHRGLSHPDVIKYYGVNFRTLEATQEQMNWYSDLIVNDTGIWWAIFTKKDGVFVGAGGLNDICKNKQKAEIGFWLLPEFWSQGVTTETMPLIFNDAFDILKLKRIEGFVETENNNCIKAMDKLGFKLEQTMLDCEEKDGASISLRAYSKIKE